MDEVIRAGNYVAIRLPSDVLKIIQIQPNTPVSLGKFGTFPADNLIGRPYHLTYEILDTHATKGDPSLRIVPAKELHELALGDSSNSEDATNGTASIDVEVVGEDGKIVMRTNQHIIDDGVSQKLTPEEIEALKQADSSGGKDIIAKILESHSALDKKTAFSLAKYTLRKTKKYMKRFTALPVDIPLLINWLLEDKDAPRIMELRLETLSLVTSWSNAHWIDSDADHDQQDRNQWLVVDEVSGLLVAALAERMGILHSNSTARALSDVNGHIPQTGAMNDAEDIVDHSSRTEEPTITKTKHHKHSAKLKQEARIQAKELAMSGTSNTITVVHQNVQPNLSLLTYFGYNVTSPDTDHPLYTNLKEISFLQLLKPEEDYAYIEPPTASEQEIKEMKSRQKSAYYRKRRRWQRTKAIVEETQAGGFAGLVVASAMAPASVLHNLVPLLRGGAQVVVYSPAIEPLTELVDYYSKARKAAYTLAEDPLCPSEEFPLDPRLLIGVSLYTSRSKPWQVLPGRTHPKMTGRGGSEGYVFVGTRVYPVVGKVEARGAHKRRKVDAQISQTQASSEIEGQERDSVNTSST